MFIGSNTDCLNPRVNLLPQGDLKQWHMIKLAVNGTLDILSACIKAKSMNSWTDVEFCRSSKMWGWTLAERAALDFAEQNNLEVVTIAPSIIVGPLIMQNIPGSVTTALALITRNEAHYSILMQHGLVHTDDLCNAHIFLYEHHVAKGRYICSSHAKTILQLAKMMRERYPEYDILIELKDCDETLKPLHHSSKKLTSLSFKFKYKVEDLFD
ncbi:hypothetical protein AMTRI_Chr07g79910 [Amborella trichopoda]